MQNMTENPQYISPNNSGRMILKKIRMHLDLSQKELADKIGTSNQTVSAWECGRREIPLEDLRNIFRIFNLDIKDFIELAPSPTDYTQVLYCKVCGSIHINTYPGTYTCCGYEACQVKGLAKISCPCLVSEKDGTLYITLDTSLYRNHYVKYIAYISENSAEIIYTPINSTAQASFKHKEGAKLYAFRNGLGLFELPYAKKQ